MKLQWFAGLNQGSYSTEMSLNLLPRLAKTFDISLTNYDGGDVPIGLWPMLQRSHAPETPAVYCTNVTDWEKPPLAGFAFVESTKLPSVHVDLINRADLVLTAGQWNKQVMQESGVDAPIETFTPAVDINVYHPNDFKRYDQPFTFLTVGTLQDRKAPELALEAFQKAFPNDQDVRYIWKSGYINNPLRPAQRYLNDPRINIIYDNLTRWQLANLYQSCDVYVAASRGEGINMPLMEAMSCGRICVATDWGGHQLYFDNEVGYLLNVERLEPAYPHGVALPRLVKQKLDYGEWALPSKEHLVGLMRQVYEDADWAKGHKARDRIVKYYRWEKTAAEIGGHLLGHFTSIPAFTYTDLPSVSNDKVLVAFGTRNRPEAVAALVASLSNQTHQDFDVLIVDDNDNPIKDNIILRSILNRLSIDNHKLDVIRGEQAGPHGALKVILTWAKDGDYDLILRLDDDLMLEPNYIEEMVKAIKISPEVGAVGGYSAFTREGWQENPDGRQNIVKRNHPSLVRSMQTFLPIDDSYLSVEHLYGGAGILFRLEAALASGGAATNLSVAGMHEEADFTYRMYCNGYKLLTVPRARCWHAQSGQGGTWDLEDGIDWNLQDATLFWHRVKRYQIDTPPANGL